MNVEIQLFIKKKLFCFQLLNFVVIGSSELCAMYLCCMWLICRSLKVENVASHLSVGNFETLILIYSSGRNEVLHVGLSPSILIIFCLLVQTLSWVRNSWRARVHVSWMACNFRNKLKALFKV